MAIREVGAQDPNLGNSPIVGPVEDYDEAELGEPEIDDTIPQACLFNDERFAHGSYVRSGDTILHCENGVWTDVGPTHPEES